MIVLFSGTTGRIARVSLLAALTLAVIALPIGIGVVGASAGFTEEVDEQGGDDGAPLESGGVSETSEETDPATARANCAKLLSAVVQYGLMESGAKRMAERAIVQGNRDAAADYLAMAVEADSLRQAATTVAALAGC